MIKLSIRTNFPEVQRKLRQLGEDIGRKACAAAMNKTIDKGRTEMVRAITQEFALKQSDVRAKLNVRRATAKAGDRIEAVLEAFPSRRGGRSANVILFAERSVTLAEARRRTKQGTKRGVFVQIKRRGGRKMIPGAFIVTANKGTFVAMREGRARYPIKAVQTGDIPQWFNTQRISKRVVDRMQREFPLEFDRAAKVFVERFNG